MSQPNYLGLEIARANRTAEQLGVTAALDSNTDRTHLISEFERLHMEDELFLRDLDTQALRQRLADSERARRKAEGELAAVDRSISLGMWKCALDGSVTYLSPALSLALAESLTGLTYSEILEKFSVDDSGVLLDQWNKALMSRKRWEREVAFRRKNGDIFRVLSVASPVLDEDGSVISYCGYHQDLSIQKLTQDELQDSHKLFSQITDHLLDQSIWLMSLPDFKLNYISPAIERIWGYRASEVKADPGILLDAVHPEERQHMQGLIARALKGEHITTDFRVVDPKSGQIRWVSSKVFPVRNARGRIFRIAGIMTDITARKEEEARLAQARQVAEAASQAKTRFLANMSHEIRTPLGAILGFTEILSKHPPEKEMCRAIDVIQRNGHQLLHIIDQILDISQVESSRLEVEKVPASPFEALQDVVTLLEPKAQNKGLELVVKPCTNKEVCLYTDPTRLRQILINLLGNAIKFTDRGRVEVECRIEKSDSMVNVRYLVRDTGRGIPKVHQSRLFQPFMQADLSTKRLFGGTGLGLALSREYASALGGDVKLLRSSSGRGSLFQVQISGESFTPSSEADTSRFKVGGSTKSLHDLKILVVDDSADNREMISSFLNSSGANVECAEDGREALRKALNETYDVILMDIQMPFVDGYEATRQLRERNYQRPILALTAHAMKGEYQRCLDAGFNDHLSKPISPKQLVETVAHYALETLH